MKNDEFKREVLEYIDKSYDEYVQYQIIITDIFKMFHEICRKHGITYYLAFGSLLGEVRDGGMIPWDADMDVLVPINQIEQLMTVLDKELTPDYYVVSNFTERNYYLCEMRICNSKYDSDIVHLDIFYLIGAPSNKKELDIFDKKVKKLFYLRALRYQHITKGETDRDKLVYYSKKAIRFFMKIVPNRVFNAECNNMLFKYDYSESDNCIIWNVGAEVLPISTLEPAQLHKGKYYDCMLPSDYDYYLKLRYGDYKNYLPIKNRFEEFYSALNRFKRSGK